MLHGSANTAGSEVTADSTSVSHAASHTGGSPQSRGTNPPRSTSTHGRGRHKSRHSHRSRNSKRSHRSRRSGDSKHKGHHHHRHNHHRHRRHHRHRHEGVTKGSTKGAQLPGFEALPAPAGTQAIDISAALPMHLIQQAMERRIKRRSPAKRRRSRRPLTMRASELRAQGRRAAGARSGSLTMITGLGKLQAQYGGGGGAGGSNLAPPSPKVSGRRAAQVDRGRSRSLQDITRAGGRGGGVEAIRAMAMASGHTYGSGDPKASTTNTKVAGVKVQSFKKHLEALVGDAAAALAPQQLSIPGNTGMQGQVVTSPAGFAQHTPMSLIPEGDEPSPGTTATAIPTSRAAVGGTDSESVASKESRRSSNNSGSGSDSSDGSYDSGSGNSSYTSSSDSGDGGRSVGRGRHHKRRRHHRRLMPRRPRYTRSTSQRSLHSRYRRHHHRHQRGTRSRPSSALKDRSITPLILYVPVPVQQGPALQYVQPQPNIMPTLGPAGVSVIGAPTAGAPMVPPRASGPGPGTLMRAATLSHLPRDTKHDRLVYAARSWHAMHSKPKPKAAAIHLVSQPGMPLDPRYAANAGTRTGYGGGGGAGSPLQRQRRLRPHGYGGSSSGSGGAMHSSDSGQSVASPRVLQRLSTEEDGNPKLAAGGGAGAGAQPYKSTGELRPPQLAYAGGSALHTLHEAQPQRPRQARLLGGGTRPVVQGREVREWHGRSRRQRPGPHLLRKSRSEGPRQLLYHSMQVIT